VRSRRIVLWLIPLLLIAILVLSLGYYVCLPKREINGTAVTCLAKALGLYHSPAWSRDGKHIAFNYMGKVYLADQDGKVVDTLTFGERMITYLAWVNDKKLLYYDLELNTISELDLTNKQEQVLVEDMPLLFGLSVNPQDTNKVLFTQYQNELATIYLYNSEQNKKQPVITGGRFFEPSWAPDGQRFCYVDLADFTEVSVKVYDFHTKDSKSIYKEKPSQMLLNLRWSPDGQWIAYWKPKNGIYILPSDGSSPPKEILKCSDILDFDWSPEGNQIVFAARNDKRGLYVLDVPGES